MDEAILPKCCFCQVDFRIGSSAPFLLHCGHDLCEVCVNSLGPENSREDVKCGVCDTVQNPKNLQKNTSRQRDVLDFTAKYRRSELVCNHTLGEERAECWCPGCDRLLCKSCRKGHENEKPTHIIFNIPKVVKREVTHMSNPASGPLEKEGSLGKRDVPQATSTERPGTETTKQSTEARNPSTEVAVETSGEVAMDTSDLPECYGSYVDPPEHRQTVQQEFSQQDLERDIESWKQNHFKQKGEKENVEQILRDLSLTDKLIEKLLAARDHEELQGKYFRQQDEIEKLKKQRIKPKPLVSVHILSEWQSLPIEDIAARISSVLARQKVDMRFNIVTSSAEVGPNSRPLLVLCVNNSRLDTDVTHALKDIRVDDGVCILILHHKDPHSKNPKNSEKVLSVARFSSPGAVADMVFWKKKGLYHCGQNDGAAAKIADFLARHARPGFK